MSRKPKSGWFTYDEAKITAPFDVRMGTEKAVESLQKIMKAVETGRTEDAKIIANQAAKLVEQEELLNLLDKDNNNIGIRYLFQTNRQLRELREAVNAALAAKETTDNSEIAATLMGSILEHQVKLHNVEPKSVLDGGELYLRNLESNKVNPELVATITRERQLKIASEKGHIVNPTKDYKPKKAVHAVTGEGKNGYIHTVCGLYQGPKGHSFKYSYSQEQVTCPACLTGKVVAKNVR